ncbi:hypothetical protein LHJ74_28640 [Streptomyces sp. N2-109]|uniref:Zinc finger CHCC-type domain-containing protein n=1 Tax=Streptomyces gossypii TaxID=2883101 RepID=A0ABT2K0Z8_9ACTN|nr:hypothetical protein [Streptomyces gossypii]MCT2593828.1 hypothetical protein [Streptomyces gossypii]
MDYEMRAEYADDVEPVRKYPPKLWHMTREGATEALCGLDLAPTAATQSPEVWGTTEGHPFCHTCGALYLREVP